MKKILFAMMAAALLVGMTGCSKDDDPFNNTKLLEQDLVGLWWDEFEYADVTETGQPFTRALLAVKADADHTGCIYLGVYDNDHEEPLAVYGGPEDAGFKWQLLSNGWIQLSDPVTGEIYAVTRSDDSNYGDKMTDVSTTRLNYSDGRMTAANGSYSGTLAKANAEQTATIEKRLTMPPLTPNTNLGDEDDLNIDDTPGSGWGR